MAISTLSFPLISEMKVPTSEIIKMRNKSHNQWNNTNIELSDCCSHGDRFVIEIFLFLQQSLSLLCTSRQKNFSRSVYSPPDARRLQKKLYRLEDYFSGGWSFPHSSLWGCWLSAAGCLDCILVSWSALSGQAAHTHRPHLALGVYTKSFLSINTGPNSVPRWKVEGHLAGSSHVALTSVR